MYRHPSSRGLRYGAAVTSFLTASGLLTVIATAMDPRALGPGAAAIDATPVVASATLVARDAVAPVGATPSSPRRSS